MMTEHEVKQGILDITENGSLTLLQMVNGIFDLFQQAGYVQLDEDQGLPPQNQKCITWDLYQKGWLEAQQDMRIKGFRRIRRE